MKIVITEKAQYRKFPTRYDLNYWYQTPDKCLEIQPWELETEIDLVKQMLLDSNVTYLSIDTQGNNFRVDLANLKHLSFLEYLSLPRGSYVNVAALKFLANLKSLFVFNDNYGETLDLSNLQSLKRLQIKNSMRNIKGIEALSQLHTLSLQKYKQKDLQLLSNLTNLKSFELVQSSIVSLDGIASINNLKCLTLFYCNKLESLKGIDNLSELEYLKLETCKGLGDYQYLAKAPLLNYLFIGSCGIVSNLQWLDNLRNLDYVGLIETDVADGDISHLLRVPTHRYTNKKHFNYFQNKYGVDIKK